MLNWSSGSTNGVSVNPQSSNPYGPDFPAISLRDIVAAQKALPDDLGARHLVTIAGPSCGGRHAFQWAADCSDFVVGIVAVVRAPKAKNVEQNSTNCKLGSLAAKLH
jgi:homoserine O-acetyltransferase